MKKNILIVTPLPHESFRVAVAEGSDYQFLIVKK